MAAAPPVISSLGDRALVLRFGDSIDARTSQRVLAAWRAIATAELPGVVDLVPAYASLTVHYDWQRLPADATAEPWAWMHDHLLAAITGHAAPAASTPRRIDVPVCYDAPFSPDMADVAALTGLASEDIIRRHTAATYQVAFLGFRPGFPYLLGLDDALAVPRLASPRQSIPAGSVGLGGAQTGVYPTRGPGGWRLIGRTPLALFDTRRDQPTTFLPGDRLRFVRIGGDEFERLAGGVSIQADDNALDHPTADASAPDIQPARDHVIDVLSPGIHTSLQDPGRPGWRHLGIGAGGASDTIAATLANALVGNPPDAAVLEMTLRGPDLMLHADVTLALAGGGMQAFADELPVPFARPVRVRAGTRLGFRPTGDGARAWLAIQGGLAAPRWLGSAAADFGGHVFGRALQAGDRLAIDRPSSCSAISESDGNASSRWWVDASAEIDSPMILRFLADPDCAPGAVDELASRVWRVALAADRTGVRLDGAPLTTIDGGRRLSSGVLYGTIQLPPDGQPIILGPDGQTVGGYPVVGHIVEADLPRLAQLKPGDLAWLQPTSLAEAHEARVAQAVAIARLHIAISGKLRPR